MPDGLSLRPCNYTNFTELKTQLRGFRQTDEMLIDLSVDVLLDGMELLVGATQSAGPERFRNDRLVIRSSSRSLGRQEAQVHIDVLLVAAESERKKNEGLRPEQRDDYYAGLLMNLTYHHNIHIRDAAIAALDRYLQSDKANANATHLGLEAAGIMATMHGVKIGSETLTTMATLAGIVQTFLRDNSWEEAPETPENRRIKATIGKCRLILEQYRAMCKLLEIQIQRMQELLGRMDKIDQEEAHKEYKLIEDINDGQILEMNNLFDRQLESYNYENGDIKYCDLAGKSNIEWLFLQDLLCLREGWQETSHNV